MSQVGAVQVGSVIGRKYRVDRVIGAGGMGIVVAATHLDLDQQVALKLLRHELAHDATVLDRFMREARSVAALRTEHVCRVFDTGRTDDGAPFIVMELLRGVDLAATVAKQPLPVALAVDYIVQACVALAEAHALGLVHRDLKPANLFVTRREDGRALVKVLDFGIAKAVDELRLTHSTSMMGSPGFMSPEQLVSPRDVDARSDLWSLGVTLYQLLSARLPFPGTQLAEYTVAATTTDPLPLEIDPRLHAVIARCLAKDPRGRFPDVTALVTALAPFGSAASRTIAGQLGAPAPSSTIGGVGIGSAPIGSAPIGSASIGNASTADGGGTIGTIGAIGNIGTMGTRAPSRTPQRAPIEPKRSRRWFYGLGAATFVSGAAIAIAVATSGGTPAPTSGTIAIDAAVASLDTAELGAHGAPPVVTTATSDAPAVAAASDALVDAPEQVALGSGRAQPKPPIPPPRPEPSRQTTPTPRPVPSDPLQPAPSDPRQPAPSGPPPHLTNPALKDVIAENERTLKETEQKIAEHKDNPDIQQSYYEGAIYIACFLYKIDKAKLYYSKLKDPSARNKTRGTCLTYNIYL